MADLILTGHTRASEEDLAAIQVELPLVERIASGEEELVPSNVVDRFIDWDPLLRIGREFCDQSQIALACVSGVNRVRIVDMEAATATVPITPCASWPIPSTSPWRISSRRHWRAVDDDPIAVQHRGHREPPIIGYDKAWSREPLP